MHRIFILLLLFSAISLSAQPKLNLIFKKEVEVYDLQDSTKIIKAEPVLYYLNLTKTVSEYFMTTEAIVDGKTQQLPSNFIYKNFDTNTYTRQLKDGEFIHENLPKLDWILKPEMKKILGYTVKKAVLNVNAEKQVIAWYSNLTYQNGPENYHRLPGLILEIEEIEVINGKNQITKFSAMSVDMSKNTKTITDPAKF